MYMGSSFGGRRRPWTLSGLGCCHRQPHSADLYTGKHIIYPFFLPNVALWAAGSSSFIVGSVLFLAGGTLNGLQIFETKTKRDSQYMLLVAMSYVIGSTCFLIVSIPYLYKLDSAKDEYKIDAFLAGIYVAGSICFTIGGIINFHRMIQGHKMHEKSELQAPFLATVVEEE